MDRLLALDRGECQRLAGKYLNTLPRKARGIRAKKMGSVNFSWFFVTYWNVEFFFWNSRGGRSPEPGKRAERPDLSRKETLVKGITLLQRVEISRKRHKLDVLPLGEQNNSKAGGHFACGLFCPAAGVERVSQAVP
ncbi:hypothetical protein [Desulfovibrio sp. TomC]|uniref:hypothetical protein n=1 Tax=Desulfovibrio sp. TomC TaxID=1562888 RepID=UPI0012E28F4B|nr:hypothetical protein [Desulfovibrio sp. TomC]